MVIGRAGHQGLPSWGSGHTAMDHLYFTRKNLGIHEMHLSSWERILQLAPSYGEYTLEIFYLCLARGVWGNQNEPECDPRLAD